MNEENIIATGEDCCYKCYNNHCGIGKAHCNCKCHHKNIEIINQKKTMTKEEIILREITDTHIKAEKSELTDSVFTYSVTEISLSKLAKFLAKHLDIKLEDLVEDKPVCGYTAPETK